jgi:predicted  nucleic acid-binding Zn-ribbon protein
MAEGSEVFREIHRLRRQVHELQEQIDRMPRQLKAQQARVARQQDALREGQEALKKLKVLVHEKELSLKSTHQLINKHRQQFNQAASTKEYDALKHEIANEQDTCNRLEEEILQGIADTEGKTAEIPELEKALQAAKDDCARFEKSSAERLADLQAQLTEATGHLAEAEVHVPPDVRPQYNRVVQALGANALAALNNRTCSACYTEVTAQNYNDVLMGKFFTCRSCGRVLYVPASVTAAEQ